MQRSECRLKQRCIETECRGFNRALRGCCTTRTVAIALPTEVCFGENLENSEARDSWQVENKCQHAVFDIWKACDVACGAMDQDASCSSRNNGNRLERLIGPCWQWRATSPCRLHLFCHLVWLSISCTYWTFSALTLICLFVLFLLFPFTLHVHLFSEACCLQEVGNIYGLLVGNITVENAIQLVHKNWE